MRIQLGDLVVGADLIGDSTESVVSDEFDQVKVGFKSIKDLPCMCVLFVLPARAPLNVIDLL